MEKNEVDKMEEDMDKSDVLANGIIRPDMPYDSTRVVFDAFNSNETLQYANDILKTEGNPNPGQRADLFNKLIGSQYSNMYATQFGEMFVKRTAKKVKDEIPANAALFVRKNLETCISAIEDSKQGSQLLADMVLNGTIYKIKGDDEHNEVYGRVMSKRELERAVKEVQEKGDRSKLQKIAEGVVKKKKLSDWGKTMVREYLWDPAVLDLFINIQMQKRTQLAQATIIRKDGSVDVRKAADIVKKSYREAWRLHDNEVSEGGDNTSGTQGDIRKYDINPFGLDIFNRTAQAEHEKYLDRVKSRYGERYSDEKDRAEKRGFAGMKTGTKAEEDEFALAV